jgi:SAM-dependent methyltransferase
MNLARVFFTALCFGLQLSFAAIAADRGGQSAATSLADQATRQTSLAHQATRQTSLADQATRQTSSLLYVQIEPSVDGIGKQYLGREIAAVMGWQGAEWLERPEREQEEGSEVLLQRLQLKPGLRVADVGAGTGYYARRIARAVAPTGSVYAVDVQPQMIALLTERAKVAGITNLVPVLAGVKSTRLAPETIDLALMVDVYHELEFPFEVLASIVKALKPGGRVVFVEYRAEDAAVPIKPLHKMTEAQVRKEAEVHALRFVETDAALPWQHLIVFEKR